MKAARRTSTNEIEDDIERAADARPQTVININVVPPVVWLDTPERTAVAEAVLQRSKYSLRRLEKRGLKIHNFPSANDDPMPNGRRRFIVVSEYLAFLRTVSD